MKQMITIGVLSILEGQPYRQVKRFWKLFETKYKSVGVQTFSHPNITLGVGETKYLKELSKDLGKEALKLKPFEIEACGIGYFDKKVIFIKIKKSKGLVDLNRNINQFLEKYDSRIFEYYTPKNWVPHITLAMNDLTVDNFEKSWSELSKRIKFKQTLHNLCIVKWLPSGKIKIYKKYELR